MAINPETRYTGKIDPSSADYPYGKARNITVPGDGTGTPWEAALVNDLFGFQQSLLSLAGITPSGDPDKVGASQYLEALLNTSLSHIETYVKLQAVDPAAQPGVFLWELWPGIKNSGGFFYWNSAVDKATADGGMIVDPDVTLANQGTGTGTGCWLRIANGAQSINMEWYGYIGGDTIDIADSLSTIATYGLNIDLGQDKTYRLSYVPDFSGGVSLSASNVVFLLDEMTVSAANIKFLKASGITIRGAAPVDTTFTSVSSVSGSAGNYSVTYAVPNGALFSVGDIIRVSDVKPGIIAPGSIPAARPTLGELRLGFFQMGEITTVGTTATISGSGVNTYLAVSDLIIIKGEVVKITAITNDTTFTISQALAFDTTGTQYWYYADNVAAGLASATGTTTVTLSGDYFDTTLNVGSLILIADAGLRRVVSVDSANTCTVNKPITATSKAWGIVTHAEAHEGSFIVTGVAGNLVTVTNKYRSSYVVPPAISAISGNIKIFKTILNFTSSALSVLDGNIRLEDIALNGDGTGYGIDQRQYAVDRKSNIAMNEDVSITNFQYGIWCNMNSSVYGQGISVCGNATRGVNCTEGGMVWLEGATLNGNGGIGILVGSGSYARLANARMNGNTLDGVRLEVGASSWCDFAYMQHNNGNGVLAVGGVNVHVVGARMISNASDGFDGQNGAYGRASGCLLFTNGDSGMRVATGNMEANQSNSIANESYNIVSTGAVIKLNESGNSGTDGGGVLVLEGGRVNANYANFTTNSIAISVQNEGTFFGKDIGLSGNYTKDTYSLTGGKVNLSNPNTTPTANVTLNTLLADFGYVYSDV